jgi:diguanylate cyclase (GGDEF)-like protein/PAS domain S-box-containing protein
LWAAGAVVAAAILAGWLLLFPPEPDLDPADITKEFALFLAVVIVFVGARRDISIMTVGLSLVLAMLWIEVVDEFTSEPRWVGTGVPAPIGVLGLVLVAIGVREAGRRRDRERRAREQAEEALRRSVSTLKAVIEGTPDAVWVKDGQGRYVLVNSAFTRLVGKPAELIVGEGDEGVLPPDLAERSARSDERALVRGDTIHFEDTLALDGVRRTLLISKNVFRDDGGNAVGLLGIARDISERKAVEERLAHQALHDALTGLPNRAAFLQRLERLLTRHRGDGRRPFAVLFLDVDRFKAINDQHGHHVGDEVLVRLAHLLAEWVRPGDVVARFGGDEFTVILLDVADADDAVHVAERIREGLSVPMRAGDLDISVSASIGVALSRPTYARAEDLLRDADAAMYRAKARGGAGYAIHDGGVGLLGSG